MLKGIPALLHADLLHALAAMGHGDELAIVDANFPAAGVGRRLFQVAGASASETLEAVLTVFPLDTSVAPAAFTMEFVGEQTALPEPVREFAAVFTRHGLGDAEIGHLARDAFYERARGAFAVVQSGELRPYGNILLVKGVIEADSAPRG
jgi:L-fucose mutarotase